MKKILLGLGLCSTLVLTGCGGKTLTCTLDQSQSGIDMKSKMIINFDDKDEAVKKVDVEMNITVDDETKKVMEQTGMSMEAFSKTMSSNFDELKEEGYTDDSKVSNNTIKFKANINSDKLSDEQKQALNLNGDSMDSIKKGLEESGFTCK